MDSTHSWPRYRGSSRFSRKPRAWRTAVNEVRLFSLLFPLFLSVHTRISATKDVQAIGNSSCTLVYSDHCDQEIMRQSLPARDEVGPALADLGISPRLLTREQAAAYCGVSLTTFAAWVRRGIVPGPVHTTHRWDRKAIDAALDMRSCIDAKLGAEEALDQWKVKQRARHVERDSS
jgi:predicted DNA-binding transcriptional regulator AlpA